MMGSVQNDILKSSEHSISNDSGLSSTSLYADSEHKVLSTIDYQDDLTKSLFFNSLYRNVLIQDDDIYSYKSKIESKTSNISKLLSINLSKTDSIKTKNPNSLSNIFEDLANLKDPHGNDVNYTKSLSSDTYSLQTNSSKDVNIEDMLFQSLPENEFLRPKKTVKKPKFNNEKEYVSSSIKDYKGDKSLSEIVSFIEGSKKLEKSTKYPISLKIESPSGDDKLPKYFQTQSVVYSDNASPISVGSKTNSPNQDVDSGVHSSHFVSLDNSEDNSVHQNPSGFQEVKSKNKKQKKVVEVCKVQAQNTKTSRNNYNRRRNNKLSQQNKLVKSSHMVRYHSDIQILDSKESFNNFLAEQFAFFHNTMAVS